MLLLECPKAHVLEYPSRVNLFTGIKHCQIPMAALLFQISINPQHTELENISFSQIWNFMTVW